MNLFTLLRRPTRLAPTRRARLSLETLGERWVPSGTDDNQYITPPDLPPQIVDFGAYEQSHGLYTLTGKVIDELPAGLTVTFGGSVVTTFGKTILTESDGVFSLTIQMRTDGNDSGTVTVQTKDAGGQLSNIARQDIDPTP